MLQASEIDEEGVGEGGWNSISRPFAVALYWLMVLIPVISSWSLDDVDEEGIDDEEGEDEEELEEGEGEEVCFLPWDEITASKVAGSNKSIFWFWLQEEDEEEDA